MHSSTFGHQVLMFVVCLNKHKRIITVLNRMGNLLETFTTFIILFIFFSFFFLKKENEKKTVKEVKIERKKETINWLFSLECDFLLPFMPSKIIFGLTLTSLVTCLLKFTLFSFLLWRIRWWVCLFTQKI